MPAPPGIIAAFGESRDGARQQTNFLANLLHRLDPRLTAVVDLAGQQGLNIAKMRATTSSRVWLGISPRRATVRATSLWLVAISARLAF